MYFIIINLHRTRDKNSKYYRTQLLTLAAEIENPNVLKTAYKYFVKLLKMKRQKNHILELST